MKNPPVTHHSITPPDWAVTAQTSRLMAVFQSAGYALRFIGGCVRDALLDERPHDLDLATDALPDRVMALVDEADGMKAIPTGIDHGTVTVLVDDERYEITTLRQDIDTDGRHAVVAFGTDWQADAQRRDFTINALNMTADGVIEDWTGGFADLKAHRVRFIGTAATRIQEDYLRMLRFFRFHIRFGGDAPDPDAMAGCRQFADQVTQLSGERIQDEISRLIVIPQAERALVLMDQVGLLRAAMTVDVSPDYLAKAVAFDRYPRANGLLGCRLLLPDDQAQLNQVADRLKISNAGRRRLISTAGVAHVDWSRMTVKRLRLLAFREGREAAQDFLWLAVTRGFIDADQFTAFHDDLAAWEPPALPVDGHDVMARGIGAGPMVKQALSHLEEWWFDQDCQADQAALLAELDRWQSVQETHANSNL
ncbi:MAG: CCA tRNA nucleotidyltransferase, partial [Pseudomonadota bacterium]